MKARAYRVPKALPLLAGAALLYVLCRGAYYVGFFNDDAFYIIGARSLLHGRYAELNAPGAPPLVNYFPGFSLLLAPVAAAAGTALWPYQLASIALTLAGLWAFAKTAETLAPESPTAALALAAFTPLTVSMSGTVLSDVPMLAGVMICLAWARSLWDEPRLVRWLPLALLAGFVALLRPTGAALPAALALALAFEQRPRHALLFWFSACLFVVPFLFRNQVLAGRSLMYFVELSQPYEGAGRSGVLAANAAGNLGYYARLIYSAMLFRAPGEPAPLVAAAVGVGAVTTLYGLRDAGAKGWRKLPVLFLALFGAAHLAWSKQAGRYVLPALPLVFAYFLRGLAVLGPRVGAGRSLPLGAAVLSLALLAAPVLKVAGASWQRRSSVTRPPERALGWIRSSTPETVVIATELDGRLHLLTGRRTVHLRKLFKPEEFHDWLKKSGATHVAVFPNDFALTTSRGDAFNDPMPAAPLRSLLADEARYEPVFSDPDERSAVFQLKDGDAP